MSYKTYEVKVYDSGGKEWYLNGKLHREDGPAIEWIDGCKSWYLNGNPLTEEEHRKQITSCDNKIVEIDGKKYQLKEIK